MDDRIRVKINVAGRMYPLTIVAKDEESIRYAGKCLDKALKEYEKNYDVQDKQDSLAMYALMTTIQLELEKERNHSKEKGECLKIEQLIALVTSNNSPM